MSLRKSETLGRWTLLDTFCLHFWAWLLNTVAITPKSEDKNCPKVFNPPEFHFSEVTFIQNWYFKYCDTKFLNSILFSLIFSFRKNIFDRCGKKKHCRQILCLYVCTIQQDCLQTGPLGQNRKICFCWIQLKKRVFICFCQGD